MTRSAVGVSGRGGRTARRRVEVGELAISGPQVVAVQWRILTLVWTR